VRIPIRFSARWGWLLAPAAVTRSNSFIEVDPSRASFTVRMGPWFDETFACSDVEDVELSEFPWYGGLGVKLGPGDSVSVVAAQDRVACIRFKRPQTMRVVFGVTRGSLRVSVDDWRQLREALLPKPGWT
jgi:hypothetical protein